MQNSYQNTFRSLVAWQRAKDLAKMIYRLTQKFPKEELYGLVDQMKRASVSVMSNLAEGNQRWTPKDRSRFLNIAYGSLVEIDNQAELSFELGFIQKDEYEELQELVNKTGFLISKLMSVVKNSKVLGTPNTLNSPKTPHSLKNPNSPNTPNFQNGFTLVELLVVIGIISIMGVGAIVGFSTLRANMGVKQAGSIVEEVVAQLESEILLEKYESTTLYFEPQHLIAVSKPKGSEETLLRWMKEKDINCPENQRHVFNTKAGNMSLKNEKNKVLMIKAMPMGGTDCLDFISSKDSEWQIQLKNESSYSPIIRFIRFNLDPEKNGEIGLSPENLRLEIQAPYAGRKLYEGENVATEPIKLVIKSSQSTNYITLQP